MNLSKNESNDQQTLYKVTASAPGKVILCGEYAVLESAPCLVMAIDRRVVIDVEINRSGQMFIDCPGFYEPGASVAWHRQQQFWYLLSDEFAGAKRDNIDGSSQVKHPLNYLLLILNELTSCYRQLVPVLQQGSHWTIDSRALFDKGSKLGLGSSAALVVALDQAFKKLAAESAIEVQPEGVEERWLRLHLVHSRVQGKLGSGVDIAASLMGSVSVFTNRLQRDDQPIQLDSIKALGSAHDSVLSGGPSEICEIRPFELPRGLSLAFVWTGVSASTPKFLSSLSDWQKQSPEDYEATFSRFSDSLFALRELGLVSTDSALKARNTLRHRGDLEESFLSLLSAFTHQLNQFAQKSRMPIFAGGHDALYKQSLQISKSDLRLVKDTPASPMLVYKPCGAGGGDLGIAVGYDGAVFNQFISSVNAMGFATINLNIDPKGVC